MRERTAVTNPRNECVALDSKRHSHCWHMESAISRLSVHFKETKNTTKRTKSTFTDRKTKTIQHNCNCNTRKERFLCHGMERKGVVGKKHNKTNEFSPQTGKTTNTLNCNCIATPERKVFIAMGKKGVVGKKHNKTNKFNPQTGKKKTAHLKLQH